MHAWVPFELVVVVAAAAESNVWAHGPASLKQTFNNLKLFNLANNSYDFSRNKKYIWRDFVEFPMDILNLLVEIGHVRNVIWNFLI